MSLACLFWHSHSADFWPGAAVARSNSASANNRRVANVSTRDFGARRQASPHHPEFVGEASGPRERGRGPGSPQSTTGSARSTSSQRSRSRKLLEGTFDLARATDHAYARASNLIREAISAEGVVFVDANVASTVVKQSRRRAGNRPSEFSDSTTSQSTGANGSSDLAHTSASEGDTSDTVGRNQRICRLNGFSTRNKSTLKGSRPSDHSFNLSDANLASLIRRYPHGKVCTP